MLGETEGEGLIETDPALEDEEEGDAVREPLLLSVAAPLDEMDTVPAEEGLMLGDGVEVAVRLGDAVVEAVRDGETVSEA